MSVEVPACPRCAANPNGLKGRRGLPRPHPEGWPGFFWCAACNKVWNDSEADDSGQIKVGGVALRNSNPWGTP